MAGRVLAEAWCVMDEGGHIKRVPHAVYGEDGMDDLLIFDKEMDAVVVSEDYPGTVPRQVIITEAR